MTPPDTLFDAQAGQARTLTVPELSAGIARLTAQAWPNDLWVSGQIRNLSRSANGHAYFDLVEPTEAGATPRATIAVTLLAPERTVVNNQIKRAGGSVRMEDGIEVRIRARLRWYEPRGTLQLRMNGIDPEFTLGRLKADRDRVLAALAADDLLEANAGLVLPLVPLRVALITSGGSAAHADVAAELTASGIAFEITLLDVRTQGVEAAAQVARALEQAGTLSTGPAPPDVVLLVRGGGATTDLAAFDAEAVARAVAACPLPVITGIGHEVDRSVADEVAHTSCKTPTAAAGVVVRQVQTFLHRLTTGWDATRRAALAATAAAPNHLEHRAARVGRAVHRVLHAEDRRLQAAARRAAGAGGRAVHLATSRVDAAEATATRRAHAQLTRALAHVGQIEARTRAHDPVHALARGWSTTTAAGRLVRSVADVRAGDTLVTRLADGTVTSTVTVVHPTPPIPPGGDDA